MSTNTRLRGPAHTTRSDDDGSAAAAAPPTMHRERRTVVVEGAPAGAPMAAPGRYMKPLPCRLDFRIMSLHALKTTSTFLVSVAHVM